jgi:hypothetical protein
VAAINSGAASTVTVTPKGDVTTVTTTPDTTKPGTNVTNTGTASATDTGVKVTVPVPSTTPVTEDDDAYVFTDANNKEIEVKTSEYDSWTPAQQLAWQTSQGLINSKPPVNTPSYVPDSTGKGGMVIGPAFLNWFPRASGPEEQKGLPATLWNSWTGGRLTK